MKKLIQILIVSITMIAVIGCAGSAKTSVKPSEKTTTCNYSHINGFSAIESSRAIKVIYTQSTSTTIKAEVPENIKQYLTIRKSGNTLVITFNDNLRIINNPRTVVYVSAPGVLSFDASSSSEIEIADISAQGKKLKLTSSSAGEIEIGRATCSSIEANASSAGEITVKNISAGDVSATCSSGADIELSGTASTATFTASSGADIDADGLLVQKASADASSGADIEVNARQLSSSTSSGGSVKNRN